MSSDMSFQPIGSKSNDPNDLPFIGTFDGQGFEIRDLKLHTSGSYGGAYCALFGRIGKTDIKTGSIRNFGVYHPSVKCASTGCYAAVIVGENEGIVENVYAIVDEFVDCIQGSDTGGEANTLTVTNIGGGAAGLVYKNDAGASLKTSYFAGTFNNNTKPVAPVYMINDGTIENCYYDSTVFCSRHQNFVQDPNWVTGVSNNDLKKLNGVSLPDFKRVSFAVNLGPDYAAETYYVSTAACVSAYAGNGQAKDYCYPRLYGFKGTGTSTDPFLISTPADLVYFPLSPEVFSSWKTNQQFYFKLENCIDMSTVAEYAYKPAEYIKFMTNDEAGNRIETAPLSWTADHPFTGVFLGTATNDTDCCFAHQHTGNVYDSKRNYNTANLQESHIINKLSINETFNNTNLRSTDKTISFITKAKFLDNIDNGVFRPAVTNLQFINAKMYAKKTDTHQYRYVFVSAVIGQMKFADLNNVHTSADISIGDVSVSAGAHIGSLAATGRFKEVKDCTSSGIVSGGFFDCDVTQKDQTYYVGGLLGNAQPGNFTGTNEDEMKIDEELAVGEKVLSDFFGTVYHCANYATVSGPMLLEGATDNASLTSGKLDLKTHESPSTVVAGITTGHLGMVGREVRYEIIHNYQGADRRVIDFDLSNAKYIVRSDQIANFGEITDVPVELQNGKVRLETPEGKDYQKPVMKEIPAGKKSIANESPNYFIYLFGISTNCNCNTYNAADIYSVYLHQVIACGIGQQRTCYGYQFGNHYRNFNNYNTGNISFYNGASGGFGIATSTSRCSKNSGNITLYEGNIYSASFASGRTGGTGVFVGGAGEGAYGCYNEGNITIRPEGIIAVDPSDSTVTKNLKNNNAAVTVSGIAAYQSAGGVYTTGTINGLFPNVNKGDIVLDGATNKMNPNYQNFEAPRERINLQLSGTGLGDSNYNYGRIQYLPNGDDTSHKIILYMCGCGNSTGNVGIAALNSINYADIKVDTKETAHECRIIGGVRTNKTAAENTYNVENIVNCGDLYFNGKLTGSVVVYGAVWSQKGTHGNRLANFGNVTIDKRTDAPDGYLYVMTVSSTTTVNSSTNLPYYNNLNCCVNGFKNMNSLPNGFYVEDGAFPAGATEMWKYSVKAIRAIVEYLRDNEGPRGRINAGGSYKNIFIMPYRYESPYATYNLNNTNMYNFGDINLDEIAVQFYIGTNADSLISGLSSMGILEDSANYGDISVTNMISSTDITINGGASGNRITNYGDITVRNSLFMSRTDQYNVYEESLSIGGVSNNNGGNYLENRGNILIEDLTKAKFRDVEYQSPVYGKTSLEDQRNNSLRMEMENIRVGGIQAAPFAYKREQLWNRMMLSNSVNYGNITVRKTAMKVTGGGLVPTTQSSMSDENYGVTIKDCINYGNLLFEDVSNYKLYVGGLAGVVHAATIQEFSNCVNFGNLTINNPNSYLWLNTMQAAEAANGTSASETVHKAWEAYRSRANYTIYLAGLVGNFNGSGKTLNSIENCANYGNITYNNSNTANDYSNTASFTSPMAIYQGGCFASSYQMQMAQRIINYGDVRCGTEPNMFFRAGGIFGYWYSYGEPIVQSDGCGFLNYGDIYSEGGLTGKDRYLGGIVGFAHIKNAVVNESGLRYLLNYGNIYSDTYSGIRLGTLFGAVAYLYQNAKNVRLDACVSVGHVTNRDSGQVETQQDRVLGVCYWTDDPHGDINNVSEYPALYYEGADTSPASSLGNLMPETTTRTIRVTIDKADDTGDSIGLFNQHFPFRENEHDEQNPFVYKEFGDLSPFLQTYMEQRFGSAIRDLGAYVMSQGTRSSDSYFPEYLFTRENEENRFDIGTHLPASYTDASLLNPNDLPDSKMASIYKAYLTSIGNSRTSKTDLEYFALQVDPEKLSTEAEVYEFRTFTHDQYPHVDNAEDMTFSQYSTEIKTSYLNAAETIKRTDITVYFSKDEMDYEGEIRLDSKILSASQKADIRFYTGAQLPNDAATDATYVDCGVDETNLITKLEENIWTEWQDVPDVLDQVSPFTINIDTRQSTARFNKLLGVLKAEDGTHYNIVNVHVVFKSLQPDASISTVILRTNYPSSGGLSILGVTSQVGRGMQLVENMPSLTHPDLDDVKYYYMVDSGLSVAAGAPAGSHNMQSAEMSAETHNPEVNVITSEISSDALLYGTLYRQDRIPSFEGYDYNDWDHIYWNDNAEAEQMADYTFRINETLKIRALSPGDPMYYGGLYRLDLYYDTTATGTNKKHFATLFLWKQHERKNTVKYLTTGSTILNGMTFTDENYWNVEDPDNRYNAYKNNAAVKYGWNAFTFPEITAESRYAHLPRSTTIESGALGQQSFSVDTDNPNGACSQTLYNKLNSITVYHDAATGAVYPLSMHGIIEIMAEEASLIRGYAFDAIYYGNHYNTLDDHNVPVASALIGGYANVGIKNYILTNSSIHDGSSNTVNLDAGYAGAQTLEVNWSSTNVDLFSSASKPEAIADNTHYASDGYSDSKVKVMFKALGAADFTDITANINTYFDTFAVDNNNHWTFVLKTTAPRGTYTITPRFDYTMQLGQYGSNIAVTDEAGDPVAVTNSDGYYHFSIPYQTLTIENQKNKESYLKAFSLNNDTSTPIVTEESENHPYPGYESRTSVIPESSADGTIVYDSAYTLLETADPTNPVNRFTITASREQLTTSSEMTMKVPYQATLKKWTAAGSPLKADGTYETTGWTACTVNDQIYTETINYPAGDSSYTIYYLVTAENNDYATVYTVTVNPEKRNKSNEIQIATIADYNGITASISNLDQDDADTLQQIYTTSQAIYNEILEEYGPITVTVKELGTSDIDYFFTKWFDYASDDLFTTYKMKNRPYDISVDLPTEYDYDVYLIATSGANHVLTIAITFSKYTSQLTENAATDLKAFVAEPVLYRGTTELVPNTVNQTGDNEDHLVAYYDIPVENFNDLSLTVRYQGEGRTYTRFKMDTVWYQQKVVNGNQTNEIIFHKYPSLTTADNVFDNTASDNWFYFKNVLSATTETEYPALTAITSNLATDNVGDPVENTDAPTRVRIYLTVDSVKYNRALEVWGLDRFPWETT